MSEAKDGLTARRQWTIYVEFNNRDGYTGIRRWTRLPADVVRWVQEPNAGRFEMFYDEATIASLTEQVEGLRHDNEMLTKGGIIEVAIRNFSVADFMNHWEGRAEAAEFKVSRLTAEVERAFRDGITYGTNVRDADPDIAWQHSRARASLSNTSEGGKE